MAIRLQGLFLLVIGLVTAVQGANYDCFAAPAEPGDRRVNVNELVFAHYNVEWMFYPEQAIWPSLEASMEHTKLVAEIVNELDADIVNFAELGDCSSLQYLQSLLNPDEGYESYLLRGTDTSTNQNVGVMTKIDPITDLERTSARVAYPLPDSLCCGPPAGTCGVPGSSTQAVSKHSFSTLNLKVDGAEVLLLSVHLLAFPTDTPRCQKREAQASVLVTQIIEPALQAGKEVIVAGDLNDYDPSIQDAAGIPPTSRVLDILKGYSLVNVAEWNDSEPLKVYSAWWDRNGNCKDDGADEHTLIDHVLVSPGLADRINSVEFVTQLYNGTCSTLRYSDHWPIRVTFDLSHNNHHHSTDPDYSALGITLLVVILSAVFFSLAVAVFFHFRRKPVASE